MNFGPGASDLLGPGTRYASVCEDAVRAFSAVLNEAPIEIRVQDAPANQTLRHNPLFRATATHDAVILRGVWLRDEWANIDAPSPSKLREIVCHELWHVRQFRSDQGRFFLTKAEAEARAIFGGGLREREGEPTVVGRAHQSPRAVAIFRTQLETREALEKYVAHASVEGITLPEWLALEEPPPAPTPAEDNNEAEVTAIRADLARLQEGLDTIRARLDRI
jgi:hypothetical protein